MKATTLRAIIALAALTLLVGGCSIGRRLVPPHSQAQAKAKPDLASEVTTLRSENAQLRKHQEALQSSMDDLQHTLAREREEQRHYRETMTKNFDLLEQSVSLTLSKTITANLGPARPQANAVSDASGSAAQAPAPGAQASRAAVAARRHRTQVAVTAQRGEHHTRTAADASGSHPATGGNALREVLTASGDPALMSDNPNAVHPTPVALVTHPRKTHPQPLAMDPDLADPAHPRKLTAHPEAQSLYEKGFSLFARKDYSQAILVFQNFLQRFPDDVYSDNAQFWIGESYLNEHRPAEAEAAYRTVLRDYAHRSTLDGYKTPDAMYRLGQLYERNGQAQHARQFFSLLAKRFPDTSPGRKAQQALNRMNEATAAR